MQAPNLMMGSTEFHTPAVPLTNRPVAIPEEGMVDEFGVHLQPLALSDSEDEKDNFDHFSMTPLQVLPITMRCT